MIPSRSEEGEAGYTKRELLEELRGLRRTLELPRVDRAVGKLSEEERQAFVASRLELSATITRLQTTLVRDIRESLEVESPELRAGIAALKDSLGDIQKASEWPGRVAKVVGIVGRIVEFLK